MAHNAKARAATVIPTLRYNDPAAAIDWLCEAFGFERHLVVPGEDGTIVHAQLVFGNGMVMLGPARASEFDDLQKPPSALGGAVSQSPYIIVDDADKHYARAVAAGAEIGIEIKDEDYGGRGYSCRDPEGHVWNFGTPLGVLGSTATARRPVPHDPEEIAVDGHPPDRSDPRMYSI